MWPEHATKENLSKRRVLARLYMFCLNIPFFKNGLQKGKMMILVVRDNINKEKENSFLAC